MKKLILGLTAMMAVCSAAALPKAFYVKKGDSFTKYNFGVAGNLDFADQGKTLNIFGYGESISLDDIDYISFTVPEVNSLTPSEQKQRLLDIGREAVGMIDLNKNAALVNMVSAFFESRYDDNDDCIYVAPAEFNVPIEYYDVHNEFRDVMKAAGLLVKGSPAATRTLKSKVVNLYKLEDYFGIYTANPKTENWEKTPADYLELRFTGVDGTQYAVRLNPSKEYTTWETVDFKGQFPVDIDITFSANSKEVAKCELNTVLSQDKSIDMKLQFIANGYVANNKMSVLNDEINDNITVTINGTRLCDVTTTVQGRNLVNYDEMYADIKEATHYHDEAGNCLGEQPEKLVAHFIRANTSADILGSLQLKGRLFNFSKLYDTLQDDSYFGEVSQGNQRIYCVGRIIGRNGDHFDVSHDDLGIIEKQIDFLNDFSDVGFYYDGKYSRQGFLSWDYIDEEDYTSYLDDPESEGYVIIDNCLVRVYRESSDYYDETIGEWRKKYGDWYYSADIVENDEYIGYERITVDAVDVIYPSTVTRHYYDVIPLLVFPDQTSFAFEDFFDEDSFKNLFDDCRDIADTYLTITGQESHDDNE